MRIADCSSALAAFIAVPVFAGPTVTVTPLSGDFGAMMTSHDGSIEGFVWGAPPQGTPGLPANLYDYAPEFLGGQASTLAWRRFSGIGGAPAFLDWVEPAAFGDDVQLDTGQGHGFLTKIHYGYANTAASATHLIRIYDMLPGDPPIAAGTVSMGSLLASIALPAMPFGASGMFVTWETSAAIQLPESFWISFDEIGPGAPDTFWLSGTSEGPPKHDKAPGYSAQGLLALGPGPDPYGYWRRGNYPGDLYLRFPDFNNEAVNANMSIALSGYFLPQPASVADAGARRPVRPATPSVRCRRPGEGPPPSRASSPEHADTAQ